MKTALIRLLSALTLALAAHGAGAQTAEPARPVPTFEPARSVVTFEPARSVVTFEPARSVLWVGNSFFYYNNSMHGHVAQLATAAKVALRGTSVTISGSGLDWHDLESLLRPDAVGRYSFVGDNEIRFNPPGRQFDTALVMDCSQCPVHPQLQQSFFDTVARDAAIAARQGVRLALFMSWAYKDKPEMTAPLAEAYGRAARRHGLQVVPAGLAFANASARRPALELYVADKRHPSLAGTYLAACTVFASLSGRSPVGLAYTAGLDADVAALLQNVAWDTVQAYGGNAAPTPQ